jgi:hypothetical protein
MAAGEAHAHPAAPLDAPAADFEQGEPQGIQLHARRAGRRQPSAQGVEQSVRRRMQQQAELLGEEAMAAAPVDLAGVLAVLDLAPHLTPVRVPVEEGERGVPPGLGEVGTGRCVKVSVAIGRQYRMGWQLDASRQTSDHTSVTEER